MDSLTKEYYKDLDQITHQFVAVLESQGINSNVLEQILSSSF